MTARGGGSHAPGVGPHLGGRFDEGCVDVGEHATARIVRGIEEHEVGLDLEGVFVSGLVQCQSPDYPSPRLREWLERRDDWGSSE